jgi:predicted DNA-binding transcriptional regulator AlpA
VTSAVRSARCPLCDTAPPGPCQAWPPADHLARWLAAEAAGRITRADLISAIGGLDVIAAQALVAERSPAPARSGRGTLTIAEICADLGISRRTFYEWRAKNRAPRCISLPNGSLRVRRAEYQRWLQTREDTA